MKRAILIILLLLQSTVVIAGFNVGDPPENQPEPELTHITGNVVAETGSRDYGYYLFLIAAFIVLAGGVFYLFQRVKPR